MRGVRQATSGLVLVDLNATDLYSISKTPLGLAATEQIPPRFAIYGPRCISDTLQDCVPDVTSLKLSISVHPARLPHRRGVCVCLSTRFIAQIPTQDRAE